MNPAIMLVDVVSANREGLKSFLQSHKCNVDTAADGESAVRCCSEMQPDLVLLYDSLPDIGKVSNFVARSRKILSINSRQSFC